jgi:hypothetical protein
MFKLFGKQKFDHLTEANLNVVHELFDVLFFGFLCAHATNGSFVFQIDALRVVLLFIERHILYISYMCVCVCVCV